MRGDARRIVHGFSAWLEHRGWTVQREIESVNLCAERSGERLYAEAKRRRGAARRE